jgi:hypothetical protein
MRLRCVDGRPVRAVTPPLLAWRTARVAAEGATALLMVWDHASGHGSAAVRTWLKAPTRRVKRDGGGRVVGCPLPSKSPRLKRIEPQGVHGQRALAAPERQGHVEELQHRICTYDDCERLESIAQ